MRRIVTRACLPIVLAAFLGSAATPALGGETTTGAVQPIGVYSGVKATEDHTYGHQVQLWRQGNLLTGCFIATLARARRAA